MTSFCALLKFAMCVITGSSDFFATMFMTRKFEVINTVALIMYSVNYICVICVCFSFFSFFVCWYNIPGLVKKCIYNNVCCPGIKLVQSLLYTSLFTIMVAENKKSKRLNK